MFYAAKVLQNLPIFGVRQKGLGTYTTQESDVQKGISRIPLPLARLVDEDILDLDKYTMNKDDCFDVDGELDQSVDLLNKAFSFLIIQKSDNSGNSNHSNSPESSVKKSITDKSIVNLQKTSAAAADADV